jgi:hypothetical protein
MIRIKLNGYDGLLLMERKSDGYVVPDFVTTTEKQLMEYHYNLGAEYRNRPEIVKRFQNRFETWRKTDVKRVKSLKDKHKGKHGYVIGNGFEIETHSKYFNRGDVLIGINKACSMIACDYNFSLDYECPEDYYSGMGKMVINVKSNPVILDKYKEKDIYICNNPGISSILPESRTQDYGVLHGKTNTMESAVHFAQYIGLKTVRLLGTNYCYKESRTQYAYLERHFEDKGEEYIFTPGLNKHARNVAAALYWIRQHGVKILNRPKGLLGLWLDQIKAIK